jgi:hypothetical protein
MNNGFNQNYNYPKYSSNSKFPLNGGYNTNSNQYNLTNMMPNQNWTSGNPNNNFRPQSTNQQNINKEQWVNFNKGFRESKPIIDPINYQNKNNLIHNNVGDYVLDEHIVEYRIMIDSIDRDVSKFKNPFKYVVKFNPSSDQTINLKNGKTRFKGDHGPSILRSFKNVKYVKLDNLILPQHHKIVESTPDNWEIDTSESLNDDRFIILSIDELDNTQTYSTNNHSDAFGIIIAGKCFGDKYFKGNPYNSQKYYKNSSLGNIDKLTIEFKDSFGEPLVIDNLDTQIEDKNDPRNPLFKQHQNHMSLIIGVVESQINTNTKFDN